MEFGNGARELVHWHPMFPPLLEDLNQLFVIPEGPLFTALEACPDFVVDLQEILYDRPDVVKLVGRRDQQHGWRSGLQVFEIGFLPRARNLGLIVASPRLLEIACSTVEQMRLVNSLCRAATVGHSLR